MKELDIVPFKQFESSSILNFTEYRIGTKNLSKCKFPYLTRIGEIGIKFFPSSIIVGARCINCIIVYIKTKEDDPGKRAKFLKEIAKETK